MSEPILVGRASELAQVAAAVERMVAGKGALLLVSGEAGIGKTTIADAFASESARAGAAVAWGRCWEAGGAPAYWPWIQVFRSLGIESPFETTQNAAPNEARDVRFRIFELAIERLRSAALERPIAIVLDDLHASDLPTLLFFQLVARMLKAGARFGILATYRDAEARLAGEAFTLLAKIAREGEPLAPARLSAADVEVWVRREQPTASADAIARVHEVSEGNPLFVEELLRVRTALDERHLPDGLRAILEEHVARVSPEARELLAVASVLGREWTVRDLVETSSGGGPPAGDPIDAVARLLGEARSAGLVRSSSAGPDVHAFTHILIRDRLYADLAPTRRAALHSKAGERLEARGDLAAAAHHLLEAEAAAPGDATMRSRATEVALGAARHALATLAFEDTTRLTERALAISERETEAACELELLRAESLIRQGEGKRGREAALEAAAVAERIGAAPLLARAALVHGAEILTAVVDPVQIALLQRAGRGLGPSDSELLARVKARLGAALVPPATNEQWAEAQAVTDEALAMARRLGDPETLLFVVRFACSARGYGVPTEARYALVSETVELATERDRPIVLLDLMGFQAAMQRERGDRRACDATIERWTKLARDYALPHYAWRPPLVFSMHALLDGDFDRAERNAHEGRRIAVDSGQFSGLVAWTLQRVATSIVRGDTSYILPDTDAMIEVFTKLSPFSAMTGAMMCLIGRTEEGRKRLDMLPAISPHDLPRLSMLGEAAIMLRDPGLAARAVEPMLTRYATSPVFWGPHGSSLMGPAPKTAARLAALVGRMEEARVAADDALRVAERLESPPLVACMRELRASLGGALSQTPRPAPAPASVRTRAAVMGLTVERDGEMWRVGSSAGVVVTLKDSKGLHYLAELVREPDREVHVTELAGVEELGGDAGPALDPKAKAAYKARLEALRDRLTDARARSDIGAAERAESEIDALAGELAGAVGLGGRDRKLGSAVERARVNVQRRLKDAIRRVAEHDEGLGRYLESTVKTGIWCSFRPL